MEIYTHTQGGEETRLNVKMQRPLGWGLLSGSLGPGATDEESCGRQFLEGGSLKGGIRQED